MDTSIENNITVEVFSGGTTPIVDSDGDLPRVDSIRYSTGYPGGLYLNASMFVPRDIARSWLIKGAQRLVIRNGQTPVFEGKIGDLDRALQRSSEGIKISVVGYWGSLLMTRRWRKRWADHRLSESVWGKVIGTSGVADYLNVSRGDGVLRMIPQVGVDWIENDAVSLRYEMPTGELVKRAVFDFDFSEGTQAWKIAFVSDPDGTPTEEWTATSSGTGSEDIALSDTSLAAEIILTSVSAQTIPSGTSPYAEFTSLVMYSETGAIDLTQIATDVVGEFTDLSADVFEIDSNTLSLVPFIEDRFPTAAEILMDAASYGDSSENQWATGVYASEVSTDDKPLLFVEQYPDLTDYDYAVRVDEPTLEPPFDISEGYIGSDENNVWNWIVVQYRDEDGFVQYVTPDDDANLTDADSITDWGQRDYLLRIRHGDVTAATNFGRRFLASHKDPVWHMTRPIKVKGSIRAKSGNLVPASEIRAGKRIRVENFLRDPALGTDDLIFLITKTDYDDSKEVCTITIGRPDSLDVILAQQALELERTRG